MRQVLQAQEYWRLKGLSADVVILNEHPASYRDEMHEQLDGARSTSGPWAGLEATGPAASSCCAATRMPEAERVLLAAVAARC